MMDVAMTDVAISSPDKGPLNGRCCRLLLLYMGQFVSAGTQVEDDFVAAMFTGHIPLLTTTREFELGRC